MKLSGFSIRCLKSLCLLCSGENIVKGDKESIKNLLEIFDGLLDYLTEHVSESSHNKSKFNHGQPAYTL